MLYIVGVIRNKTKQVLYFNELLSLCEMKLLHRYGRWIGISLENQFPDIL